MTSRRHFLQSTGKAVLALPFLPSLARANSVARPAQKFAVFYTPIGVIRSGFFPGEVNRKEVKHTGFVGSVGKEGLQSKVGATPLQLTQTMQPLEKVKDKISLVTGLDRTFQVGTDVHAQCGSCFLSSAAPFEVQDSAWPLNRTLDHVVADHIGKDTPFSTLEFSANSHKDNKESIYFDNISWYGTGHVAPSMRDPRAAYERLFGTKNTKQGKDVTDLVLADAKDMERKLGREDRDKFGEYYESIRTIEKRIERLEKLHATLEEIPLAEPTDAHMPRGEYMRLLGDLMVAALQTGLTRVATLMAGPERWDTPMTYDGLFEGPRSHHVMSHNPLKYENDLKKLDQFHVAQYAYIVSRMDAIKEADGSTLLDNTLFTFGSGLGDGSTHQYNDLPIIVAGSGGKKLKTGLHVHTENATPLANLWLTQAKSLGLRLEKFADSKGVLSDILA